MKALAIHKKESIDQGIKQNVDMHMSEKKPNKLLL